MRYETPIFFQRTVPGAYDPASGNYVDDSVEETKAFASVMDTKTETMRLIYGEIRQGGFTIQLQNHYTKPFDHIRIGSKRYTVDYRRRLRVKDVYFASEVQ